jgi:hypothetical protein
VGTFTSELTITQLSGNDRHGWRLWRLAEPLIYEVGERGSGRVILVSKGFITDGPSIPQFLWAILPVWASWSRAGVIHDYLCCLIALNNPHPEAPTRDHADRIFLEAMKVLNVGWVQKTLLYLGVRIGTWLNVRTTMVDHNIKLAEIAATGGARAWSERFEMVNPLSALPLPG